MEKKRSNKILEHILIVYKPGNKSLAKKVKKFLKDHGCNIEVCSRRYIKQKIDTCTLCIVVGGDGTFIRVAQLLSPNITVFAINPNPGHTEGFFTRATRDDYHQKLEKIIKKDYSLIRLNRLKVMIGNKLIKELAINEVCFTNKHSYEVSRYSLLGEKQKSSGVIISTAAGSHAWLNSAGGKKMKISSQDIQYIVREPYHGKYSKAILLNKILPEKKKVNIVSMMDNGILALDSRRPGHIIKRGTKIVISASKEKIGFIDI